MYNILPRLSHWLVYNPHNVIIVIQEVNMYCIWNKKITNISRLKVNNVIVQKTPFDAFIMRTPNHESLFFKYSTVYFVVGVGEYCWSGGIVAPPSTQTRQLVVGVRSESTLSPEQVESLFQVQAIQLIS